MTDYRQKIDYSITRLVTQYPFFAPIGLKLRVSENMTIPTIRTNGVDLEYSPIFIESLTLKQTMFVILHEWYHVIRLHHTRRNDRNPKRWNIAADYEINADLKALHGIEEIPGMLYDARYLDMPVEAIYSHLDDQQDQDDQQQQSGQIGEVTDHPALGQQQGQDQQDKTRNEIEQQVKNDIVTGMQLAKMRGQLPAQIERLLGKLVEPQIDWRSALVDFIQTKAKNDYSFARPNTRFAHTGFYLPSLYSEQLPALVFACDTSGSIDEEALREYSTDLINAFESVNISQLFVIWCDSTVNSVQVFEKGDTLDLKPEGGGGTSFRPPFEYVYKNGIEPAGLIYLTDGYCHRFPAEPDYPVLWCVYGKNDGFNPPFGRVLKVNFK
jgi:predicted metal-dependent peptidase